MRCRIYSRLIQRDCQWGRCSLRARFEQTRTVVWYQDTNEEHHPNVEDQDPPKDLTYGARDGAARIRSLPGSYPNHLRTSVEGACYDKGFCDTIDAVGKSAWVVPVFEADFLGADAAGRDDDGNDEKDGDRDDFDTNSLGLVLDP